MADGNIEIKIGASTNALNSAVAKAKKQLQDLAKNAEKDSDQMSKALDDAVKDIMKSFEGLEDLDAEKLRDALQDTVDKSEQVADSFDDTSKATENLESKQSSLNTQLKAIQRAMAEMEASGRTDTVEFQQMAIEAGRLKDAIADAHTRISVLADDDAGIKAVSNAMTGLAGAGSTATGVMALLGDESGDLQKVMVKLQSVMAITNGLQAVANTLNKDSATSIYAQVTGSKLLQTIKQSAYPTQVAENKAIEENTVAQKANNVAKGQSVTATAQDTASKIANTTATATATTANFSLAGAIKGVGLAIKSALGPFGLIATAVGGLVALYMKLTSESRKWEKTQKEVNDNVANSLGPVIAKMDTMKISFDLALKNDSAEQWVKDNKSFFEEYGASINNVSDAIDFFDKKQQLIAKIKATDSIEQWTEQMGNAQVDLVKLKDDLDKYNSEAERYEKLAEKAKSEPVSAVSQIGGSMTGINTSKTPYQTYTDNATDARNNAKDVEAQMETIIGRINQYEEQIRTTTEEANKAEAELGYKAIADQKNIEDEKLTILEDEKDREFEIRQKMINNREDGYAKEMDQARLDLEKERANIQKEREELEQSQSGGLTDTQKAQFDQLDKEANTSYLKRVVEIRKEYRDVIDASLSDFDQRMAEIEREHENNISTIDKQEADERNSGNWSDDSEAVYNNTRLAEDRRYNQEKNALIREQEEEAYQLQYKTEQERIAMLNDGYQKDIANAKLASEQRAHELEVQEKEWRDQSGNNSLTKDQEKYLAQATSANTQELAKSTQEALNNALGQYATYYQRLATLHEEYEQKRQSIEDAYAEGRMSEQEKDYALEQTDREEEGEQGSIAEEFASRSEEFEAFCNSLEDMSMRRLLKEQERLGALIEELKQSADTDPKIQEQLAVAQAENQAVKDTMKNLSDQDGELKNNQKNWKNSDKAVDGLCKTLDGLADLCDETTGGTLKTYSQAIGSVYEAGKSIVDNVDQMVGIIKTINQEGVTAIKAAESASVILAIIGAIMQVAQAIASLFNSHQKEMEDLQEAQDYYNAYISVLDDVIDKKKELAESLVGQEAVDAYDVVAQLYETEAASAKELGKAYVNAGADWNHRSNGYEMMEKANKYADQAASALGMTTKEFKELTGGRGEGLFDLTSEQLEKLKEGAPSYWASLDEDVRNWLQEIIDCDENIEQLAWDLKENLTQISFDELSSNLQDTFQDMTSSAEDFESQFRDIMWNAISNLSLGEDSEYQAWLNDWYDRLADAIANGADPQTMEDLWNESEEKSQEFIEARDELLDSYDFLKESVDDEANTLSGALSSASQESIDLLAGQTNACRINQMTEIDIMNESLDLMQTLTSQLNMADAMSYDVIQSQLEELILIREATSTMAQFAEPMHNYLSSIDKSCADIADGDDLRASGVTSF